MLINLRHFLHIPIFTESGTKLGRVYDLNIDIEVHTVKSYLVRANIFGRSYLIKPSQIITISKDKIVVEDAVIKAVALSEIKDEIKVESLAEVAMSQEK